jgi:hypothetical protein
MDMMRLRRVAPLLVPTMLAIGGWVLLVRPAAAERERIIGRMADAQLRIAQIQAAINEPMPRMTSADPAAVFARRMASGDATSAVLEQLARLASAELAGDLTIETGERVDVAVTSGGPRVDEAPLDPRFALFDTPLAYSPLTMSFEAEYRHVGQFLWNLRDLATLVEVRRLEIKPQPERVRPTLHVSLTLLAYAKPAAPRAMTPTNGGAR